jgi:hypothetical protein
MWNKLLKIFLVVGGLILIGFGLFWGISLSFQGKYVENPLDIAVLLIVGIASLIIGLRKSVKP